MDTVFLGYIALDSNQGGNEVCFNKHIFILGECSCKPVHALTNLFPDVPPSMLLAAGGQVICLEFLDVTEALPCGHALFHPRCIRAWLQRQPCCPVCRFDVRQPIALQGYRQSNPRMTVHFRGRPSPRVDNRAVTAQRRAMFYLDLL